MLNLLLDKNINGDIIYNQSEDKENDDLMYSLTLSSDFFGQGFLLK